MIEWFLRILGAILLGLLAAGLWWKVRRDQAAGVVERRDENGQSMPTLHRRTDPAAFRRHVLVQYLLIGLAVLLALAVLLIWPVG